MVVDMTLTPAKYSDLAICVVLPPKRASTNYVVAGGGVRHPIVAPHGSGPQGVYIVATLQAEGDFIDSVRVLHDFAPFTTGMVESPRGAPGESPETPKVFLFFFKNIFQKNAERGQAATLSFFT